MTAKSAGSRTPNGPAETLLAAKFRSAAVPPDVVVRRRLLDVLREGVRGPLTLVSAPAGYGKTVLVACWAARSHSTTTVMHLTMDEGDESSAGFWTSVLEGLTRAGVDMTGVRTSATAQAFDRLMLMRLVERIVANGEPVVWVLDSGEYGLSPMLGTALHRVIDGCAGLLRVVILTRTDPPIPLHRYRLAGQITELRAADLAFTATEASSMMQRAGLDVDPVDVVALQSRTGGWPAGLKFAAMALSGRADIDRAIDEFRGDLGNVAAYLMSEVLAKQPPELRDFSLRTCLVDEIDAGLVSALTGQHCDSRALQFMAQGNSFIEPVPGVQGHYRYQSLYREFLRGQLSLDAPALVPVLHRAAADWLARDGQLLAAIRHAVAGSAWATAARIVVEDVGVGRLLVGAQKEVLRPLLRALPADADGPEAAVTRAALALGELDSARCTAELHAARKGLDRDRFSEMHACSLAIGLLEAVNASLGADLDLALDTALAAESAVRLTAADDLAAHPEPRVIVAGCLGRVLLQRGDFDAARSALDEGIAAAHAPDLADALADLHGMAALVEAVTGHLRQATDIATRWRSQPDGTGVEPVFESPAATLALGWVRTDEFDLAAARDLVRQAESAVPSYDARVLSGVLTLLRSRLLATHGEFDLAHAELTAARGPTTWPGSGWLDRALVNGQAAALLAQSLPERALDTFLAFGDRDHIECEPLMRQALLGCGLDVPGLTDPSAATLDGASLDTQVNRRLLLAAESLRHGDADTAEHHLEGALRLAAPEHLRRPFVEASESVRVLLEASGLGSRSKWLQTHGSGSVVDRPPAATTGEQSQAWSGGPGGSSPVVNPLTKKEQEVLAHLADLLTTEEIAEAMFVSVNTVRSHVRSILRKLGVTRRNEAVRRAWDLSLLPPRNAA